MGEWGARGTEALRNGTVLSNCDSGDKRVSGGSGELAELTRAKMANRQQPAARVTVLRYRDDGEEESEGPHTAKAVDPREPKGGGKPQTNQSSKGDGGGKRSRGQHIFFLLIIRKLLAPPCSSPILHLSLGDHLVVSLFVKIL